MLLGHYGIAFAAKRVAPQTSLGTLAFAAQWLDLLWPVLLLAGLEHVDVVPGITRANPLDFVSYPYSHSLLFVLLWSVIIAGVFLAVRHRRRDALLVGALVASHWFLDLLMHRPDLPLYPGSARFGLGIWQSLPFTITIELLAFFGGLLIYLRSTSALRRSATIALAAFVTTLLLIFFSGFFSPPPPGQQAIGMVTLGLWLFVPWLAWIDRNRARRNH